MVKHTSKSLHLILLVACLVLVAGCSPAPDSDRGTQQGSNWPTDLVTPIEGATFSLVEGHLPGASREYRNGAHQGFDFSNGYSGRILSQEEPAVAVAGGDIIRIDQDYIDPGDSALEYWADQTDNPGFLGDYAIDQLRGRQVWIRHEKGHISRYAHLSRVNPELAPGDTVEQGQPVGLIGTRSLPPTADQPEPAPFLHYELWSPDATSHLGENLDALKTHKLLADVFSKDALPRHTRQVLSRIKSGQEPPDEYPPTDLTATEFSADMPETITAGTAFTFPVQWEAQEFEARDLFAVLEEQPMGLLEADGGAVAVGAVSIDFGQDDVTLTLGGVDKYGQTLTGSRVIQVHSPEVTVKPLEVDASILALQTEENKERELAQFRSAGDFSLRQHTPSWTRPFQAPLDGDIVGVFGQRLFHGMLRPQHPLPGVLVIPTEDTAVKASNDGTVALVSELPIRGSTVAIAHGGGIVSVYARLDGIHVSEGDKVQRGEPLGSLNQSGDLQDRLLLWEIHVTGIPTNPQDWLDRTLPQ